MYPEIANSICPEESKAGQLCRVHHTGTCLNKELIFYATAIKPRRQIFYGKRKKRVPMLSKPGLCGKPEVFFS